MDLIMRALVLLGLFLLVGLAAVVLQRRRRAWLPLEPILSPSALPIRSAAPLHLVTFTSPLCGDCHEAPRVALEAAPEVPLITLDVRDHPALVRRLGVHTTPTFLLLDEGGRIRWSHAGLPDPVELWLYVREAWDSTATVRALHADRRAVHAPQR